MGTKDVARMFKGHSKLAAKDPVIAISLTAGWTQREAVRCGKPSGQSEYPAHDLLAIQAQPLQMLLRAILRY
jgi:hypothetical protein